MWNGVEAPAQLSGANVISANISGKSGQGFRKAATNDEEIFVNHRRAGQRDETRRDIASEPLTQIDSSLVTESRDGLAGLCVQFVNKVHHADDDAAIFVIRAGPVAETAVRLCANNAGIELPFQFSGGGVEGEDFLCWRDAV